MANRSWSRVLAAAASITLACGVGGCAASGLAERPVAPKATSATPIASGGSPQVPQAKLEACYAASPESPNLSVATDALYFAREGKYVFVDISVPAAPALEACLRRAILSSTPFPPPSTDAHALIGGAIAVRLGPAPSQPPAPPSLDQVRERVRRVTLEAWKQGALSAEDAPVRELLSPSPAWPNPEQRAQLEACYAATREAHGGAILHRDVIYLSRAGRILLADVKIPESPQLERCLLERIHDWSAAFSVVGETVLSSFLVHLGTDREEYPNGPMDLQSMLARRDALVKRAAELGLVSAEDPLMTKLKVGRRE